MLIHTINFNYPLYMTKIYPFCGQTVQLTGQKVGARVTVHFNLLNWSIHLINQ